MTMPISRHSVSCEYSRGDFPLVDGSAKHRRARFRRRGQTLLLAVLLMVFAALLGATFIAVVATNLNSTARSGAKTQAETQLRAGEIFARLRFSEAGLNWRPKRSENVPQPSDIDFPFYYDDYDRARGWSSSGATDGADASTRNAFERDGFAKFPDPRNETPRDGHFMLRVARVQAGDDDNAARDKTGDLRVEIIGRAAENAAVFASQTFYLKGATSHPLTANMRTVSNWNFASNAVPSGEIVAPVANAKLLTLRNLTAPFPPDGNFYITIGGLNSAAVQSALVESVVGDTLKLTAPLSANAGERVEIAAAFGAPAALDFDFDGFTDATREAVDFSLSQNVAGGLRANGGLLFDGRVLASLRGKPRADAQGLPSASLRASGLMRVFDAPSGAISNVKISGEYAQGNGAPQNVANAQLSTSSTDAAFPGNWGAMTPSEKAQLVDDGWNRLRGEIIGERCVTEFVPPDIAREQGAAYRRVSRFSPPRNSADGAAASQFGYGEGIYLDNASDIEKVGVAPDVYRAMTPSEFRDLVSDGATAANRGYGRNDAPQIATANGKSLEEQHLRGWIGPDEFRARGALLEIDADNARVFITRDARDDRSSAAQTQNLEPAPHKGWRRADGTLAGDATLGGVYKTEFAWPKNGVVFAEGNLRVRGAASTRSADPGRSLTIVSQGNIFIEGSLDAGARKILLLARKNVVLNPTGAVLSRVEAMTRLSVATGTSSSNKTIRVHDATAFQTGDSIELMKTSSNTLGRRVTRIVDATTLELDTAVTSSEPYVAGSVVRTIDDPLSQPATGTKGVPFVGPCTHLELFSQAIQRRAVFPAGATTARIAFRHSAQRKDALKISAVNATTSTSRAQLLNKAAASTRDSDLRAPYKHLDIYHDAGVDVFPAPFPSNAAAAAPMFLDVLAGQIAARRTAPNWYYTAVVQNGYDVGTLTGPKKPPYYFLASVGNRLENGAMVLPDAKNILTSIGYSIPMATSVALSRDGNSAAMQDERWNAALGTFGLTTQFGFSAAFGDNTDPPTSREDALTVDQTFYNGAAYADSGPYTLDSRSIDAAPGTHSLVLRLNNNVVNGNKTVEDYFKAPTTTRVLSDIPYYRLSRWKLENATFDAASHELDSLSPYATNSDGATISVRAYVYAQEGSWLIIPGDFFDSAVNGAADLDRDGVISRREEVAAHRYHRYNYRIDFHGAITENRSAVIESSGVVRGAVADWTDKWATISLNNLAAGFNPNAQSSAAGNFATIHYSFDDDAARGLLEGDEGFRLPLTPDGWRRG